MKRNKKNPLISVVMSVYNGENHLRDAIDSILAQTFKDFEFIIINDGSTDDTLKIIKSYKDSRIILISRESRGLVTSLNEGIRIAKGKYIARQDADDISAVNRIASQYDYLESNRECAVIASTICQIDSEGNLIGDWIEDIHNLDYSQIKEYMPKSNCIAHPSVMMRTALIKKYQYRDIEAGEDYELWLRLLSDGMEIHKIPEKLVYYRVHQSSITQLSNRKSVMIKLLRVKWSFLTNKILHLKFNKFDFQVLVNMLYPRSLSIVKYIKKIAHLPWLVFERLFFIQPVRIDSNKTKPRIVFLLPWLVMGGADKVVLDLIKGLSDEYDISIILTESSSNEWKYRFEEWANIIVLDEVLAFKRNYIKYISIYVAQNDIDKIIISNSAVGYAALPAIKYRVPDVRVFDILHGQGGLIDLGSGPALSIPYRKYIEKGITVTEYLIEFMHHNYHVDRESLICIYNGVQKDLSCSSNNRFIPPKATENCKVVVWLGRFSIEKQPLLALEIAKEVLLKTSNTIFLFAGTGDLLSNAEKYIIENQLGNKVYLLGMVDDVWGLIASSDILLMTSEMEGLPIAILEAMFVGLPIVSTKVGGIPEIVKDGINGYLITPDSNAVNIISEKLGMLLKSDGLAKNMGKHSKEMAKKLSTERMIDVYKKTIK